MISNWLPNYSVPVMHLLVLIVNVPSVCCWNSLIHIFSFICLSHYLSPTVSVPVFSFTCFISPVLLLFVSMFMSQFSFHFFYFSFYIPPPSLCPNFSVFLSALPSAHTNTHSHCRISILPYLLAELLLLLLLLQCFCTHFFSTFLTPRNCKERNAQVVVWKIIIFLVCFTLHFMQQYVYSALSTIFQKDVQHFSMSALVEDSCWSFVDAYHLEGF